MLADQDDPAQMELLGEILANTKMNASVVVAGEDGIHWKAGRAAAKTIKYVESHSPKEPTILAWPRSQWCLLMLLFFPALITRVPATSFPSN